MPNTAGGLPYPAGSDAPDVPGDMQALAEAVDTTKIAKSIVDAKGDLIVATAADTVSRLAVGTNGQVLTANSGAAAGVSWATPPASLNASTTITATNASWSIPTLASPVMKVTVVGGGGGGAGDNSGAPTAGGSGGTSSVTASGINVTAAGGAGANGGQSAGRSGTAGLSAGNQGSGTTGSSNSGNNSSSGAGGAITVAYINVSGLSTLNITIGAGGSGGAGSSYPGGAGGRGEVIIEYAAG